MHTPRFSRRWLIIPLVVCVVIIAVWFIADTWARHRLQATRALFAENGHPSDLGELVPRAVPDADNAARVIARAQAAIASLPRLESSGDSPNALWDIHDLHVELPERIKESPERETEALTQLRHRLSDPAIVGLLEMGREASSLSHFVPEIDYGTGPAAIIGDHVGTIRHLLRLLAARATVNIHDGGDPAEIWADLLAGDRLAMLAAQGPTLIDMLTSVACSGIVRQPCLEALSAGVMPPDAQATIDHFVRRYRALDSRLPRAMAGERVIALDWTTDRFLEGSVDLEDTLQLINPTSTPSRWFAGLLRPIRRTWSTVDLAVLYRAHFDFLEVTRNAPSHAWVVAFADLNARVERDRWPLAGTFQLFQNLALVELADQSGQRLLTIALAAATRSEATGIWPESLDSLGLPPGVLIDPCSGRSMHYVKLTDRLRIYADGPDGKDDGGRDWQSGNERSIQNGDIVMEIKLSR